METIILIVVCAVLGGGLLIFVRMREAKETAEARETASQRGEVLRQTLERGQSGARALEVVAAEAGDVAVGVLDDGSGVVVVKATWPEGASDASQTAKPKLDPRRVQGNQLVGAEVEVTRGMVVDKKGKVKSTIGRAVDLYVQVADPRQPLVHLRMASELTEPDAFEEAVFQARRLQALVRAVMHLARPAAAAPASAPRPAAARPTEPARRPTNPAGRSTDSGPRPTDPGSTDEGRRRLAREEAARLAGERGIDLPRR